jgi:integrase/recombinase XerD
MSIFGRPNESDLMFSSLNQVFRLEISGFIDEMKRNRNSPKTIRQYRFYLLHLYNRVGISVLSMSKNDLNGFITIISSKGLVGKPISPSSQRTMYSCLNSFFKFYEREDLFLNRNKVKGKSDDEPKIFSKKERDNFFELAFDLFGLFWASLFEFSYWEGLRVDDVIELRVKNIDFVRNKVYIKGGKGSKDATIPLMPRARDCLQKYMKACSDFEPNQEYLFEYTYLKGEKKGLTTKLYMVLIHTKFNKVIKEMGLIDGFTFHSLRHSIASHLLKAGVNIKFIQNLLRHSPNSNVTMRYLHLLDTELSEEELGRLE